MGLHYVSIAAYMMSSILIMWSNKQVLAVYNFPSTLALMLCQCSLSLIVFVVLHILGKVRIEILSYKRLKFHVPLLSVTVINIFFGLKASAGMPAAMFTALRRLSILLCMYAQMYFLDQNCLPQLSVLSGVPLLELRWPLFMIFLLILVHTSMLC